MWFSHHRLGTTLFPIFHYAAPVIPAPLFTRSLFCNLALGCDLRSPRRNIAPTSPPAGRCFSCHNCSLQLPAFQSPCIRWPMDQDSMRRSQVVENMGLLMV